MMATATVIEPRQARTDRPGADGHVALTPVLALEELTLGYDGHEVIQNLSLGVTPGQIYGLVGPSGGGKTTAMKMVNRLISITDGDITIDGRSVRQLELTKQALGQS